MRRNPTLLTISLFILFSGCASYEFSNKSAGEGTSVGLLEFEEPITLLDVIERNNPESGRGLITTDVLIEGANLAIQGVKSVIDKSQEKYNQNYLGGVQNARFYAANSKAGMLDPDQITFKGFEFHRTFKIREDEREVAVYARFVMDESKMEDIYFNSKFYMTLDSFSMAYSKVKLNKKRWYMPWTWFLKEARTINIDMDIDITANWLDEFGHINKGVSFGHFSLPLRNVPMNPFAENRNAYFDNLKGTSLSGASYIIPRSVTFCTDEMGELSKCYGRGDFNIDIEVVETSKSDFVTRKLSENSDDIFEGIKGKDIINLLPKKN